MSARDNYAVNPWKVKLGKVASPWVRREREVDGSR